MIEMPEIFQKVKLQIAVVLRRVRKDNFSFLKDSLSLSHHLRVSCPLAVASRLLAFFFCYSYQKQRHRRQAVKTKGNSLVKKTQGMHVTSYRISRLLLMDSRPESVMKYAPFKRVRNVTSLTFALSKNKQSNAGFSFFFPFLNFGEPSEAERQTLTK